MINEASLMHTEVKSEKPEQAADNCRPSQCGVLTQCRPSVYFRALCAVMQWADQQPKSCGGSQNKHTGLHKATVFGSRQQLRYH